MSVKKAAGDVHELVEESLDLSEYLIEIARGVAEAQQILDENSIESAKKLADEDLARQWGISATWFRIPEVEVELKLAFDLRGPSAGDDSSRLTCTSVNAMYQNTFAFGINAASNLKARIVAIPHGAAGGGAES